MFLRSLVILVPVAFGGVYFAGGLGGGYSRDVNKPQAEVMAALDDLDIGEQSGSPGTDPAASASVKPLVRVERGVDSMTWIVMSGNQVATRMTAHFKPIQKGAATRVTASVERGDAPDDLVSPEFRSNGIMLGLFSLALESELDELTHPPGSPEMCQQMIEDFETRNGSPDMRYQGNHVDALGDEAKVIIKLIALRDELIRNGCDREVSKEFKPVSSAMSETSSNPVPKRDPNISFEPGKPMIDLSRKHR